MFIAEAQKLERMFQWTCRTYTAVPFAWVIWNTGTSIVAWTFTLHDLVLMRTSQDPRRNLDHDSMI